MSSTGIVSLAGRDGFGRNSNVYGFDFGSHSASAPRTCGTSTHVVSLAGRDGFDRDANVYGFDFGNSSASAPRTSTRYSTAPAQSRQANKLRKSKSKSKSNATSHERRSLKARLSAGLRNFQRKWWRDRHQQTEAQKARAERWEKSFGDHAIGCLLGCAG